MQLKLISPTATGHAPAASAPAYLAGPLDDGQRALALKWVSIIGDDVPVRAALVRQLLGIPRTKLTWKTWKRCAR